MDTDKLKALLKEIHDYLWNGGKRNPAEAFNEFRPDKFSMESYLEFKILGLIKTLKE